MSKDYGKRFVVTESQGNAILDGLVQILVDKETGVNYLWRHEGNAGGLTPLLDEEGKPVITKM
jgi:hypothetical protein